VTAAGSPNAVCQVAEGKSGRAVVAFLNRGVPCANAFVRGGKVMSASWRIWSASPKSGFRFSGHEARQSKTSASPKKSGSRFSDHEARPKKKAAESLLLCYWDRGCAQGVYSFNPF
jgi:hypothetical protein